MFENIKQFFKKFDKKENETMNNSREAAKERLHLVLMQDRANVSADFLELMKQEIIDVIKKYIEVDEKSIDVRLTNKENTDGTNGAPALYANIPILNIKNEARKVDVKVEKNETHKNEKEAEQVEKKRENASKTKKVKEEKTTITESKKVEENDEEIHEKAKTSAKRKTKKHEENDSIDNAEVEENLEKDKAKEKVKSEN